MILGLVRAAALLIPVGSSASAQTAPKGTSEPVVSGPKVQGQTLRTANRNVERLDADDVPVPLAPL
jgi:hypothetical protein